MTAAAILVSHSFLPTLKLTYFTRPPPQFSDDEADDKRVVRSAKEKKFEVLHGFIKSIRNSMKIKDFNKMLTSYEDLLKAFEKARPVIAKEKEKDRAEEKSLKWLVGDSPRLHLLIILLIHLHLLLILLILHLLTLLTLLLLL